MSECNVSNKDLDTLLSEVKDNILNLTIWYIWQLQVEKLCEILKGMSLLECKRTLLETCPNLKCHTQTFFQESVF